MNVSIDNEIAFDKKPGKEDIKKITRRMKRKSISVAELAHAIVQGHTWCPGVFTDDKRQTENWLQQEVFALDFDDTLSFADFMERANRYDLKPAFVYTTFSSVGENKFRPVFVLPVVISDERVRYAIQFTLFRIFSESDSACKDASRMFFGGKELIYKQYDARLELPTLFEAICLYIHKTASAHLTRDTEVYCQQVGLNMINGLPDVYLIEGDLQEAGANVENGRFEHNSYNILYRTCGGISQYLQFGFSGLPNYTRNSRRYPEIAHKTKARPDATRNVDWKKLYDRCPIFQDFMNGVDKHHSITRFVACNLIYLEGGESKFFEGLQRRSEYDLDKWRGYIGYFKKRNYQPERYDNAVGFYPDAAMQVRASTLVEAARLPRGHINVFEKPVFQPIQVVQARLNQALHDAMNRAKPGVIVIRVDTGVGKTQKVIESICPERPLLIVVPTHKLKDEVRNRALAQDKEVLVAPELCNHLDSKRLATVNQYYALGAAREASILLRDWAKTDSSVAKYVAAKDALAHAHDKTVITTHASLPYLETKHETIVIDEDIIPTLFPQAQTKAEDLMQLAETVRPKGFGRRQTLDEQTIQSLLDYVQQAPDGEVQKMPKREWENIAEIEKAVSSSPIASDILHFLASTHFIKKDDTVYYIGRQSLPNKNIIILSATANKIIYERALENVEFVDTGRAELKGTLLQYTQRSFSRSALIEHEELIDQAQAIVKGLPIITYKRLKEKFANVVATFGALAGIDSFGGKDIAIIGTPHLIESSYLLFGAALGVNISEQDYNGLKYCPVTRNGYEFYFMTYQNNPLLQEIQLHKVESELVQAVGRARLVNNECCVTVLSSFPLLGAEFVYTTTAVEAEIVVDCCKE